MCANDVALPLMAVADSLPFMGKHHLFHFSVTLASEDLAVVGCLRSLSQHCNPEINPRIPWGELNWRIGREMAIESLSTSRVR